MIEKAALVFANEIFFKVLLVSYLKILKFEISLTNDLKFYARNDS